MLDCICTTLQKAVEQARPLPKLKRATDDAKAQKRPGNAGPSSILPRREAYRFSSVVWITNFLRIAST
ncbi:MULTISPECIES: hypothetical protein, partial [unclassified Stenotrophomonas]|uniref:hypothetical protein n=1 Tax=unclassified Stenotrophomonas TaxID=196198 RepID=UPI00244BD329